MGRFPERIDFQDGPNAPAVPAGWTPNRWASRLRAVADACQEDHPDRATELRRMADALDGGKVFDETGGLSSCVYTRTMI